MMLSQLSMHGWESALFDHLWQSTAVAIAAWLLTIALRNNSARIRYLIWMFASIKFLVPFRLLTNIGAHWAKPALHNSQAGFYLFVEEFSRPFQPTQLSGPGVSAIAVSSHSMPLVWALIATILWLSGCMVLLAKWISDWRRASALVGASRPVVEGREFDALRRAQRRARIGQGITLRLSPSEIEPGVFGFIRPALLWPTGLTDRLDETQMEAIMSHELEHVCRRDNLSCALHALVETLFWFHPLVRWMSKKMTEERERACDEKVMQLSARPEAYAESILKVCGFCLEPPTPCISGVSGADLKERILRIMTRRSGVALSTGRKLILSAAAILILVLPVGFGMLHGQTAAVAGVPSAQNSSAPASLPKYDIASIKPYKADDGRVMMQITPDGISLHGVPLRLMVQESLGVEQDRILGEPAWISSSRYDIEAKVEPEEAPKLKDLKMEQRNAMMLQLLVDRFNLKYHHEKRELPMYALVVAKSGLKMKPTKPDEDPPQTDAPKSGDAPKPGDGAPKMGRHMFMMNPGHLESTGASTDMLAHVLSRQLSRTVMNKTGLTGEYDFALDYTPDNMPMPVHGGPEGGPKPEGQSADAGAPSLFTAVEEQLGLKLEATKAMVDVIVIDHIDMPSEN
ncbi:MAG TPA: TIGR03435 family protein [Terracidiphilus sp.]|jgi:uncharacterized protein (TIGR03435 family)